MSSGRTFKLYTGQEIPAVGLGTWVSKIHSACDTLYDDAVGPLLADKT